MNKYFESTEATKVERFKGIKHKENYDIFLRIYGTSLEDMRITFYPTDDVKYAFKSFLNILLDVVKSQKKQLDYSGYYISFLLDQISEKEFEKISKKYIDEKKKIPMDLLKDKIYIIQSLIGQDITPKDMAHYFQCEEKDIIKALNLLKA